MEVALISGNQALRLEIDDMRMMPHPVKPWVIEHKHGMVRAIAKYFDPSPELVREALAELDALRRASPVKQYERQQVAVAVAAGG
jgi:hypothetical protein